jgi:ABC-type multidrug transport system fused ATPase/permease subunit
MTSYIKKRKSLIKEGILQEIFKHLIDTVTGFRTSNISFIIAVVLSMALGNIIIGAITSRIATKISIRVNNEIQADIYDAIMKTDCEALSQFHCKSIISGCSNLVV